MKTSMKQVSRFSMLATLLSLAIAGGVAFAVGPSDNTMFTGNDLEYIREMNSGHTYPAEAVSTAPKAKTISNTMLTDSDQEVMQVGKMDIPPEVAENKPVVKKRTVSNTMFTDADQEYISGSQDSLNLEALSDSAPAAMGE